MKIIETIAQMEAERVRMEGSVGFVPTMGFLHEGHLSLVRRARADSDHVVVSVFVNPTQFGPGEDLDRYPRDRERDLRLLEGERVDIVFMPSVEEMYPPAFDDWVEVRGPLVTRLEGAARPGHFRGVTTVVARLLRIVRPQRAYFGEKDAQQLRVIRQMVRELALPVEIVPCPTVREPDGLAMSSRNAYLSPEERRAATVLWRALCRVEDLFGAGERDAEALRQAMRELIEREPLARTDYVSIADSESLEELTAIDRAALVLLAVRIGPASPAGRSTHLIDNTLLLPEGVEVPGGPPDPSL